jgi:hypothetical protein
LTGYCLVTLFLVFIAYSFVQEKKDNTSKKTLLYAMFTIMTAITLEFIDTDYFSKLDRNPFEDIVLSSSVILFISLIVLCTRFLFIKGSLSSFKTMFNPSNILYLVFVIILGCEYAPTLLEFTMFDFLDPATIMCLYTCQGIIGATLDRFYYGVKYSIQLFCYFFGLVTGSFFIAKGSTIVKNNKTDYSIFRYIKNSRIFHGISTRTMLDKGKT